MSSYLNFYIVSKESKKKYKGDGEEEVVMLNTEPLNLISYSRNSDVYRAFDDVLNIAYAGNEDKYTVLTKEKMTEVVDDVKSDLAKAEKRLEVNYKIIKQCYHEDVWSEIQSSEEYVEELKDTLRQLSFFEELVENVNDDYNDLDKVLINIS